MAKKLVVRNCKGYDYTLEGNVVTVINKDGTKVQKELELGKSVYNTVMSVIRGFTKKVRTENNVRRVGNFTYKYEEGILTVMNKDGDFIAEEALENDKYLRLKAMTLICNTLGE